MGDFEYERYSDALLRGLLLDPHHVLTPETRSGIGAEIERRRREREPAPPPPADATDWETAHLRSARLRMMSNATLRHLLGNLPDDETRTLVCAEVKRRRNICDGNCSCPGDEPRVDMAKIDPECPLHGRLWAPGKPRDGLAGVRAANEATVEDAPSKTYLEYLVSLSRRTLLALYAEAQGRIDEIAHEVERRGLSEPGPSPAGVREDICRDGLVAATRDLAHEPPGDDEPGDDEPPGVRVPFRPTNAERDTILAALLLWERRLPKMGRKRKDRGLIDIATNEGEHPLLGPPSLHDLMDDLNIDWEALAERNADVLAGLEELIAGLTDGSLAAARRREREAAQVAAPVPPAEREPEKMTLDKFRGTRTLVDDIGAYLDAAGTETRMGGPQAAYVYAGSYYIEIRPDCGWHNQELSQRFHLLCESSDLMSDDLPRLEAMLYEWAVSDDGIKAP